MIKKSPLKDKPLRYAAQSLDEEIHRLKFEDALQYVLTSFFLFLITILEWYRFIKELPPMPKALTVFTVLFLLFTVYKTRQILKKVGSMRLGRDGERAVGQYLDNLREKGHRIFHDIVGDNFNLDHVIISEKGILVIETKTYSKPGKGEAKIFFDGEYLSSTTFGRINNPVIQVNSASKWLQNILLETTGKNFSVKPVILFPGWFIESKGNAKKSNVWVLNPKALPAFIENLPNIISKEDMMLATFHISRFIRTTEKKEHH